MPEVTKESIIKKLREKGLKITPQRLAITDVLIEHRVLHPGARLVYEEAKKEKEELEPVDRLCDAQQVFSSRHHQNTQV